MDNVCQFSPSLRYFQGPARLLLRDLCDRILIDLGTSLPARQIFTRTATSHGIYVAEAEAYAQYLGRNRFHSGRNTLGAAFAVARRLFDTPKLPSQDRHALLCCVCGERPLPLLTFTFCGNPTGHVRLHLGLLLQESFPEGVPEAVFCGK